MTIERSEIEFEPKEFSEDRSWCFEGKVTWIDLVWEDFRLERGHTVDDKEWTLFYRKREVAVVRSIRKAKDEILDILED